MPLFRKKIRFEKHVFSYKLLIKSSKESSLVMFSFLRNQYRNLRYNLLNLFNKVECLKRLTINQQQVTNNHQFKLTINNL